MLAYDISSCIKRLPVSSLATSDRASRLWCNTITLPESKS